MNKPKVISKRSVYKCDYFEIREDELAFDNGSKWTYAHSRVDHGGVSIVALDDDSMITLIREYRYTLDSKILGLPCGGVDDGQKPLESAVKELQEEAGLKAQKWTSIGKFYASPGNSNDTGYIFLATELTKVTRNVEDYEDIEVVKMPFDQAVQKVYAGEILDAWAIIPILRTNQYLEYGRA